MNLKKVGFMAAFFSLSIIGCSSQPGSPASSSSVPSTGSTQTRRTMVNDVPRVSLSGVINASNRLAGMDGVLDIKNIRGITAFKAWNLYPAIAFTENDRHMAWMFYNTGTQESPVWNLVKLGGNAYVPADGSGTSTWFREPAGMVAYPTAFALTYPGYGAYDANFIYIADRGNKKIKLMTVMRFKDAPYTGIINTLSSDYVTLGETPQGMAISGTTLFVSTAEGNIYKITGANTAIKITSLGISNLHGLATDGVNLYYSAGKKAYKVGVDQDPSTQSVSLVSSTAEFSDASNWKDVAVYGNYVYLSDSTQASVSTEGSCIYRAKKDGSDTGYEVYAGNAGESGNLISDPSTVNAGDARLEARFKNPVAIAVDSSSYASSQVLYIADMGNKNIRVIPGLADDSGRVEGVNVDNSSPLNVFEPRALAVSPGGQVLYTAASSEYRMKKVYLDGRANAVENITLAGEPWAIYDLKVVQEQYQTDQGLQWVDRIIFAFEVNKSDWTGRVSVYDLKDGTYYPLIGPAIPKLGEFTGALALNATGTKLWITSRNLNEGAVYKMDIVYDADGKPQLRSGVSMDSLSIFIKKTGFYPAGITYVKDPSTQAEYILLGYYEGASILTTTAFKMARITLNWGMKTRSSGDIDPIVPDDLTDEGGAVTDFSLIWSYLTDETLTSGYYYPRAMTAAGKYAYWTSNSSYKVFSADVTNPSAGQAVENAFTFFGAIPIYCTGFALDPLSQKLYFSNDLTNQVYGN